ncbi:MAG: shikimate kinase AroK [Vulcanimicrobiaceae bacterium]
MAAGKTTVGRHLARELELPFVDTDDLIVVRAGPIAALFERAGETGFRNAELAAVREALDGPLAVIALGGGAVTHAPTRALLAERALRVYLDVPVETLVARLRRSRTVRPLVGDDPTVERVRELLELREPWYREADLAVRSAHTSKLAYARSIARAIREAGVASVARATSKRAL